MSGVSGRRSADYLRDDADPSECYGCGASGVGLYVHHVSYFPETTVPVCSTCHGKIHSDTEQFASLQPDQERPADYEKHRRREERMEKHVENTRIFCGRCSSQRPLAEMYPLSVEYQAVRRKLREDEPVESLDTDWWCFLCMGEGNPGRAAR